MSVSATPGASGQRQSVSAPQKSPLDKAKLVASLTYQYWTTDVPSEQLAKAIKSEIGEMAGKVAAFVIENLPTIIGACLISSQAFWALFLVAVTVKAIKPTFFESNLDLTEKLLGAAGYVAAAKVAYNACMSVLPIDPYSYVMAAAINCVVCHLCFREIRASKKVAEEAARASGNSEGERKLTAAGRTSRSGSPLDDFENVNHSPTAANTSRKGSTQQGSQPKRGTHSPSATAFRSNS